MEVILLDAIKNLGMPGDVVKVTDGYARNFLLPKRLAKKATQGALKEIETIKRKNLAKITKMRENATAIKDELEKQEIVFNVKVSDKGTLFGSVSEKDILSRLRDKFSNLDIERRDIIMPNGHIKELGEHKIRVKLFEGVEAEINVKVDKKEEN
jgi:large subunit ribosomal protein L9